MVLVQNWLKVRRKKVRTVVKKKPSRPHPSPKVPVVNWPRVHSKLAQPSQLLLRVQAKRHKQVASAMRVLVPKMKRLCPLQPATKFVRQTSPPLKKPSLYELHRKRKQLEQLKPKQLQLWVLNHWLQVYRVVVTIWLHRIRLLRLKTPE